MEFGYFTLSDNHYDNNLRSPISSWRILPRRPFMPTRSACIPPGSASTISTRLAFSPVPTGAAYIAARTKHIRLAPAVTVLPLHHPIRVAEQWATLDLLSNGRVDFAAGRGYDKREYLPFNVSFESNQSIFDEGLELVRKLWQAEGRISHHGQHYQFDDVRITPKPMQQPIPTYVASFSKPSIELAGRLGCGLIVAPFAAAMSYGGLKQVADLYHASCAKHGKKPERLMCSYFTHFADTRAQEAAQRAAADPVLQGMRHSALPGRSKDRSAELSLLHRHGGTAGQSPARGSDGELRAARKFGTHHRHPQEGRDRRIRRGHPLCQCRFETTHAGQGRNGPLHARGGPGIFRQAQDAGRMKAHELSCRERGASRRCRYPLSRAARSRRYPAVTRGTQRVGRRCRRGGGFQRVYLSGAAMSASMGLPDLGIITLDDACFFIRQVARSAGLPVLVDGDTGYGEVLNAMHMVRSFEDAGAAPFTSRTRLLPKKCGHLNDKRLADPTDMAAKIAAAVKARRHLYVIARTDAVASEGMEGAVARAQHYIDAGADANFPEALNNREMFREFARRVPGPLAGEHDGVRPHTVLHRHEFQEMGYKMIIWPASALRIAAKAQEELYAAIRCDGGTHEHGRSHANPH